MNQLLLALLICVALVASQELRVDKDGMVIVPRLGKVPKECTHLVPHGTHLKKEGVHTWVIPPTGKPWKLPLCDFLKNRAAENRAAESKKRQFPPSYQGWLGYTTWQIQKSIGSTFDAFTGYFSVPQAPARTPEVLFIFTGLQNVDWIPKIDPEPPVFDILQPVLQYPSDVIADSLGSWAVRSWYVSLNSNTAYTHEISAEVGSQVFGNMTRLSGNKWLCDSVNSNGDHAPLTVSHPRLKNQPWAYTTVEYYGDRGCSYLPTNELYFSEMILTAGGKVITQDAKWVDHVTPNPMCKTTAHVSNASSVYYTFD